MRARPVPQFAEPTILPAPTGGVNALDNLMAMPPEDCIHAVNYVAQTNGCEVRKGYVEWGKEFSNASVGVRTMISYVGSTTSADRLFACTNEGIYNVTASATSYSVGASGHTWATKTGLAGYCSYVEFTTLGDKYLLVCDEVNGLVMYTESAGTWAAVTAITGATETTFVYVTVWKQRLWFITRDSGTAYYLPVGLAPNAAVAATAFHFGNKFLQGGYLNSLHNLTHDGGVGPEDYLVAISSAGDVVCYQGTDPANMATFNIVGNWNIGVLPVGRSIACSVGGDLYVLCEGGVISIAQLLKGADPGVPPTYITGKVTPSIRALVAEYGEDRGWFLLSVPSEGLVILGIPDTTNSFSNYLQYAMQTSKRSWIPWQGVPMTCATVWHKTLYFGTVEQAGDGGRIYRYRGALDNVREATNETGNPISAFLLTSFTPGKVGGVNHRLQFVKPQFIAGGTPLYEVEARYDFDIHPNDDVLAGTLPPANFSVWSSPWTWADTVWGDEASTPVAELRGVVGMGRFMAVALRTKSSFPTTLVGFTLMYDSGGLL